MDKLLWNTVQKWTLRVCNVWQACYSCECLEALQPSCISNSEKNSLKTGELSVSCDIQYDHLVPWYKLFFSLLLLFFFISLYCSLIFGICTCFCSWVTAAFCFYVVLFYFVMCKWKSAEGNVAVVYLGNYFVIPLAMTIFGVSCRHADLGGWRTLLLTSLHEMTQR